MKPPIAITLIAVAVFALLYPKEVSDPDGSPWPVPRRKQLSWSGQWPTQVVFANVEWSRLLGQSVSWFVSIEDMHGQTNDALPAINRAIAMAYLVNAAGVDGGDRDYHVYDTVSIPYREQPILIRNFTFISHHTNTLLHIQVSP